MERRNDRFRACLDRLDHRDGGRLARRLAEFRNISTRHEGAPGASDHDGGDARIARRPQYQVEKPDPDLVFHGIDRRIIDRDDGNVAVGSHAHKFRHARRSPYSWLRVPNVGVRNGKCEQARFAPSARCGELLPAERARGQQFVADAVLWLDTSEAAASDDLARTVSYAEIAARIAEIIAGEPVALIETLAQRIAAACLAYDQVQQAEVTVHKPDAPVGVPVRDVSVTIRRGRA